MSRLDEIFAHKRAEVAARASVRARWKRCATRRPRRRTALDFVAALRAAADRPALIAEVKPASPSRGELAGRTADSFDPVALAPGLRGERSGGDQRAHRRSVLRRLRWTTCGRSRAALPGRPAAAQRLRLRPVPGLRGAGGRRRRGPADRRLPGRCPSCWRPARAGRGAGHGGAGRGAQPRRARHGAGRRRAPWSGSTTATCTISPSAWRRRLALRRRVPARACCLVAESGIHTADDVARWRRPRASTPSWSARRWSLRADVGRAACVNCRAQPSAGDPRTRAGSEA